MAMVHARFVSIVMALALAVAACSRVPNDASQSSPTSRLSGRAIIALDARGISMLPKDRFALPSFDFARFQNLLGRLTSKGVPVVVNIWASWCGPCRIESPNLVKAAKRHGTQVQFLGVDILDKRGPARAFIKEEGYPYPSVFNPTGDIRDGLGYIGQPVTIFFDARGRKVDQWSGPIGLPQLLDRISKILPP
jgi:thiol-disulfide isomerase/thioredoxin